VDEENRRGGQELGDEVAIGDGVDRILGQAVEAELTRDERAVDGIGDSRQRAGAERHDVDARAAIGEALVVTSEHVVVGEKVMRQQHRLRPLLVGVARHHEVDVLARQSRDSFPHLVERDPEIADDFLEIHPRVEHDLIVATARGVQAASSRADDLGKPPLDGGVDVLVGREKTEAVAEEFLADLAEAVEDLVGVFLGNDALAREHLAVRLAAAQIVGPQPPVEAQGRGEFLRHPARRRGESSLPELLGPARHEKTSDSSKAASIPESPSAQAELRARRAHLES
jgi:hypothetical protein